MSNDDIRKAFIAGFMVSSEGHNGEYAMGWDGNKSTPEAEAARHADQYLEHEYVSRSATETGSTSDVADFIKRIAREHGRGVKGFREFRFLWEDITGERLGLREAHDLWKEHR